MKYTQWLNIWLENYMKPSAKPKTYLRYSEIVNKQLALNFEKYDMNELTPIIFQKFITDLLTSGNKRTGEGLSANTVNTIITVIQSSMRTAYNLGYTENEISGNDVI